MTDPMTLGFIGLGRMGGAMASRLIAAGNEVMVYDINPAAVSALVSAGATAAPNVPALANRCATVLLSLPTLDSVLSTVLGKDGIVAGQSVRTVVDLSTSGPAIAVKLSDALSERGIASIDAPVSGGIAGARNGKLSLMVSGPEPAFEAVRPVLEVLGKIFFMGPAAGAGQTGNLAAAKGLRAGQRPTAPPCRGSATALAKRVCRSSKPDSQL